MSILKFKQFESSSQDYNFPSFQDVEDYLQDFIDECNINLYGYQSGFKFYKKNRQPLISFKAGGKGKFYSFENVLSDTSSYIDILNTNIPDNKLSCAYGCIDTKNILKSTYNNTILNSIKKGAKSYKHLMIKFPNKLLFTKSQLDILIECLKRLYLAEGFRPYGDLFNHDIFYDNQNNINFEFQGMLVNCSDEEYIRVCQLEPQIGISNLENNKKLFKHFI